MSTFWDNVDLSTFLQDELEGYDKPVRVRMREIIKDLPIHNALEVGCGPGVDCRSFQTVRPDVLYTGIDLTEKMVAFCTSVYPHCTFKIGDVHALPFESDEFDLVYSKDVLNHLEYWEQGFSELVRVSKRFVLINFFLGLGTRSELCHRDPYGYVERYISWSEALMVMESYHPKSITINPVFCPPNGKETLVLIEKSS